LRSQEEQLFQCRQTLCGALACLSEVVRSESLTRWFHMREVDIIELKRCQVLLSTILMAYEKPVNESL
jgi:hypothetical protein